MLISNLKSTNYDVNMCCCFLQKEVSNLLKFKMNLETNFQMIDKVKILNVNFYCLLKKRDRRARYNEIDI